MQYLQFRPSGVSLKLARLFPSFLAAFFLSTFVACYAAKSPGETYLEFISVLQKTNSLAEANAFMLEPEKPKIAIDGSWEKSNQSLLELMKSIHPKTAGVVSEKVNGSKATVVIKGKCLCIRVGAPDVPCDGTIGLVKVGDDWKIESFKIGDTSAAPAPAGSMAGKTGMAAGVISGQKFTVADAKVNSGELVLSSEKVGTGPLKDYAKFTVDLHFVVPITSMENQTFSGTSRFNGPKCDINLSTRYDGHLKSWGNYNGYTLALRFYKQANGLLPGYIDLKMKDGSSLKGFFYAKRVPNSEHIF